MTGLSRAAMLAALPVLLSQGRAAQRSTPRLPDAEGCSGVAGTGRPSSSVLVVGDSVAAGVGVDHQVNCLAGRLASRLAVATDRAVAWSVLARTGAKASGVRRLVEAAGTLADPDLVVLSVGIDVLDGAFAADGFHPSTAAHDRIAEEILPG